MNNWIERGKFPDEFPIVLRPNKQRDKAFHPSSDCLTCARVLYSQRSGEEADWKPSLEARKSFLLGFFYHELIYYALQDLGFSEPGDIEEKIEMELYGVPVKGHIDVSRCVIPVHGDWMVDIKTQQAMKFAKDPAGDLFEKYVAQQQMYMWLKDKEKCMILWAEKDTPHRYKETYIERDDDAVEQVFEKWSTVIEAEKEGVPPHCTCGTCVY
ncbi:MAG: hypothetical protein KGL39_24470 [Patescibacteria group bacterium]|nr:hypothetical protein [Patescibacteria group bacterium]